MADYFNKNRFTNSGITTGLSSSVSPGRPFFLEEVRFTLTGTSDGVSNDFTVDLNAAAGSAYDLNYLTQSMSGVTWVSWHPEREIPFEAGDYLDFAWTNNGATYGLSVIWRGMWQIGN